MSAVVVRTHRRRPFRIPPCGQARVVHGDYGLHNVLVSPESGAVQAVLDWELGTLGDPLADLGWLLVRWLEPTDAFVPVPDPVTVLSGFPARKEIVDRYAARSPLDVSEIDFYVALAWWKTAVVLEGVYARHAASNGSASAHSSTNRAAPGASKLSTSTSAITDRIEANAPASGPTTPASTMPQS